ncbi:MAG: RagB/SusD family nutrient uptake outer membrane protein [Bacteroidales bacterium]|nr:RagB/SusD family nutrient uptake outer membrane protein [Bacteroidales bacterium]
MKKINILSLCGLSLVASLSITSCNDILDEQPRSGYDMTFFTTEEGVKGGLTALYAHLRNIYGQAYFFGACEVGTDEYTWGHSGENNQFALDMSGKGELNPTSCRADAIWGQSFIDINTASTVITNASSVGIAPDLVAEAYFFRAFHYFNLVQTFGGVPLDLGGGELKPNSAPNNTSVRNTVDEVYEKCIFPDLEKAVADLNETPRVVGGVTKNVARLYLSKAYLTYAWWLENPNNIATYPETTKRDKSLAKGYFQKAYDTALAAINNPAGYKLQETFRDVNLFENDRNAEWMLWADHTQDSEQYNGAGLGWGNGAAPENFVGWFTQWNYCGDMKAKGESGEIFNPVMREPSQGLGRPWTRMAPIPDALKKFTDQDKDSRFDASFTLQYRVNMAKGGKADAFVYGANDAHIANGETFLQFFGDDKPGVSYAQENGQINAGVLAGYDCFVINLSDISRRTYPAVWKTIGVRTDRDMEKELGNPNAGSTRPYVFAKFSELYLIAAEAAVKGATGAQSARDLVNVLRRRAGVWTYSVNDNKPVSADYGEALANLTPATIDVDYILDERLREFWGEGYRWFDLVRTQKWVERASVYHIADDFGRKAIEVKRDIKPEYYLRPIPSGQMDALEMSDAEKKAYQNPGYN